MSSVVYASSRQVPLPASEVVNWHRFELTYRGWDGSVWDLRDPLSGVIVLNDGILGLHNPEWEIQTSTSPARPGRRRLGARTKERAFALTTYLWDDDGTEEWLDLYRRFMSAFHPVKPGTFTLRAGKQTHTLEVFLDSDGGHVYTRDPGYDGWSRYPFALTAEDPYWKGEPITRSWSKTEPEPFFGADGNLHISSGAALETAQMSNPGDVDAWIEWTVVAAAAAIKATLTVDGGTIVTPLIPPGQTLVIVTDPTVGTVDLEGVDVSGLADPWDPRPIPAGGVVPLQLQLDGFGTVSATFVPRRFRGL